MSTICTLLRWGENDRETESFSKFNVVSFKYKMKYLNEKLYFI